MVSGGIFAVLGVAMQQAGNAVPFSFLLAGAITLLTAYSYIKLTLYYGENGGAFSFIEHAVDNRHVAGFFGWVLIVGYIGVMAMYAFAFGAYTAGLFELGANSFARKAISASVVLGLVGLNIVGVRETGLLEDVLVYIKAAFLLLIAGAGILLYDGSFPGIFASLVSDPVSPVIGFAVIFVAYEGFQLLCYDYSEIENVEKNLKIGMYTAIIAAILIYISVSYMASLQLTPQMVAQHKEYALAKAVTPYLGQVGFALVVVTAIQSTASGINATLFGSSRLAHRVATEKELPRVFSFRNRKGIPTYALVITGILTVAFTWFGSLEQITEFGSVAFLVADGAANYANLRLWRKTDSHPLIPALGFLGTLAALPIIVHHLYVTEPAILMNIFVIFGTLLLFEFLYIERKPIEEEVEKVEEEVKEDMEKVEDEI